MSTASVSRRAGRLLPAIVAALVCVAGVASVPVRAASPAMPLADGVQHCGAPNLQAAVTCVEPSVLRVVVELSASEYSEGTSLVVRTDATGTYVLTNRHVVEGGVAKHIFAVSPNGTRSYPARAVFANTGKPGTAGDLAIIKLAPGLGLRPLAFGNSQKLSAGEQVSSIGYGLGLKGEPSVTEGIVSAVHRDLGDGYGPVWIQHQSIINHGNSGGPLITLSGDVVGINTLSITDIPHGPSGIQGLFFAIPGNAAQKIATALIAKLEGTKVLPPPDVVSAPYHSKGFSVTLPRGWFVGHLADRTAAVRGPRSADAGSGAGAERTGPPAQRRPAACPAAGGGAALRHQLHEGDLQHQHLHR